MIDTPAAVTETDCPVCGHMLGIEATGRVRHTEQGNCPCPCDGSWADPHRHPTGDYYEPLSDGLVRIEQFETGRTGLFTPDGTWQSGDVKFADIHMAYFAASLSPRPGEEH